MGKSGSHNLTAKFKTMIDCFGWEWRTVSTCMNWGHHDFVRDLRSRGEAVYTSRKRAAYAALCLPSPLGSCEHAMLTNSVGSRRSGGRACLPQFNQCHRCSCHR